MSDTFFTSNDVVLCHEGDVPYLKEYIDALCGSVVPVYIYTNKTPALTDAEKRYVCICRVPFDVLPPVTTIPAVFINTEHLADPRKKVVFNAYAASARVGAIYDFSRKNVGAAAGRSTHLPLLECAKDTERLVTYMAEAKGSLSRNVACVGTTTQHRIDVINGLRQRGISVDFIECFGEERDRRVAACKLLLNLHAGKIFKPWEALRCNRWRYAGMPVVSEPCDVDVSALTDAANKQNAVLIASTDDLDALAVTLRGLLTGASSGSAAGTAAASALTAASVPAPLEAASGTPPCGGAGTRKKARRQTHRK